MLIIVEGIDRVGKSTLVEKIRKATGFYVYHNNTKFNVDKMDSDNEADKMLKMLQVYDASDPEIIFDRFHWTDYVYGSIERDYKFERAAKNLYMLEDELKKRDARIILVKPTDIKESSRQHGKDLTIHEMTFDTLYAISKLKKYECTYTVIDDAVAWIKNEVNEYIKEHGC